VLGQRAFAWFLAAAIVALALLCLFYGTAFAPILRGGRDSFHLGFRARTLTGALPADLALPSIPVRNLTSRFSLPSSVDSSTRDVWFADRSPARACRGVQACDARHSELIPCLDRELHYRLRLCLNLSPMEHYERHCPPTPRHLNCLIPPPDGYRARKTKDHVSVCIF
jgi:hypothetical protein